MSLIKVYTFPNSNIADTFVELIVILCLSSWVSTSSIIFEQKRALLYFIHIGYKWQKYVYNHCVWFKFAFLTLLSLDFIFYLVPFTIIYKYLSTYRYNSLFSLLTYLIIDGAIRVLCWVYCITNLFSILLFEKFYSFFTIHTFLEMLYLSKKFLLSYSKLYLFKFIFYFRNHVQYQKHLYMFTYSWHSWFFFSGNHISCLVLSIFISCHVRKYCY